MGHANPLFIQRVKRISFSWTLESSSQPRDLFTLDVFVVSEETSLIMFNFSPSYFDFRQAFRSYANYANQGPTYNIFIYFYKANINANKIIQTNNY